LSGTLLIINDPPYGTERAYNALRLARALVGKDGQAVRIFLIGDAVSCARSGQQVPHGYYNVETMLRAVVDRGGEVGVCGSCMDARAIEAQALVEGCQRSGMDELADWTVEADRSLVF